MANIIVSLDHTIGQYETVVFKAPCDCTEVTGLQLSYPVEGDNGITTATKTVTFKDAHGNALTGLGNLFAQNALVKVLVDVDAIAAYIQNADTNQYLENKISAAKVSLSSSVSSTSTTTAANSAAVKTAYDKAAEAADPTVGSGTVLTSTDYGYPNSVSSQDVTWKEINRVIYVRANVTCTFNSVFTNAYLPISISALPGGSPDLCVVSSLKSFNTDSTVREHAITCIPDVYSGKIVFEFGTDDLSIFSGKTATIQVSAIITRTVQ